MSTNRLEIVAQFNGMTLYKRVARNGSSAWAWVGGPAYVLSNDKGEILHEFDWHSDAIAKARFALGHDYFEGGRAPYPVCSVATGELVAPAE